MKSWQELMLGSLVAFFEAKLDVLAVLVFGSLSTPEEPYDRWSDIDMILVVEPDSLQHFFPATDWLETFGRVYACDQAENEFRKITRVCFDDMRRVDFVFTTEDMLASVEIWPRNPLQRGAKVMFSRSPVVDEIAMHFHKEPKSPKFSEERFYALTQGFRFKSMLAVYKVVRNDLLIASHLVLDLLRDYCFLGMALRDRAVGMDFHKTGGEWNRYISELEGTLKTLSGTGILEMIRRVSLIFERLAKEWDPHFESDLEPIESWIEEANNEIGIG